MSLIKRKSYCKCKIAWLIERDKSKYNEDKVTKVINDVERTLTIINKITVYIQSKNQVRFTFFFIIYTEIY